ncbi:Homoprotocatechuate catabolism bifunctional isomerase/decarboxylase [wastewater metagenome]|uniref:Homoprotocatechuate catabolism bifunctional isomerase/decarboxylase n=2 Tax=unclassified sequences TaxID=12908 RepID=A0A5B8RJ74_9ZZZZ|nr:fumarylacetoacetate hydrolase family protein [Arhodomonas sp. KWT]QEA07782.1 homoprotocatechuate catabolism bifunctional isomerase/decarboxylase [uncultured organism]
MTSTTLRPGGPLLSGAVYGCLLNVRDELDRLGDAIDEPPYNGAPTGPVLYVKTPNTHIAAGAPVPIPADVDRVRVGASLGVVIRDTLTRADTGQAAAAIAGYTLVNDVTVPHESLFRHPLKQKCRDGFCPIGPWLVDAADLPDPATLSVRAFVNGECRHEAGLDRLVRPVATLLADISDFTSLYPGDLILAGVSPDVPLAGPGDTVAVEIDGLGRLVNPLVRESSHREHTS